VARLRETSPNVDLKNSVGISRLAMTQNSILNSFSDRLQTEESQFKLPDINLKSVTEKDFCNLLDKLDEVISPRIISAEILIKEGVSSVFSLNAENFQLFKIHAKDKKCPLTIKVKAIHGHIQSLVSLSELKNLDSLKFLNSKSNFHEIYDVRSSFSSDFIFICIRAVTISSFKFMSEFGRHKFTSNYKHYEKTSALNNSNDSWEVSEPLKKTHTKNFIKENQQKLISPKPETKKGEIWTSRREMVLKRRKNQEKAKKKKLIEDLNKRVKRLEEEAMGQERATKKQKLLKFCKEWMKFLYIAKSVLSIRDWISIKRNEFFSKIKLSRKVHMIQSYYKSHLQPRTNAKAIANHTLLLFRGIFKQSTLRSSNKSICTFIGNSARTNLLFHIFASFGEKVLWLQRAYRRYLKKKNFRMATLRIQWNKCIDRNMYSKKNSGARKRESVKYISLPNTTRDTLLKDFYHDRWKDFLFEVREYSKNLAFQRENPFLRLPEFKYIPSDVIMEAMIRAAVPGRKVEVHK
jgi:hypothetical protein